jgi:hypothetical protein
MSAIKNKSSLQDDILLVNKLCGRRCSLQKSCDLFCLTLSRKFLCLLSVMHTQVQPGGVSAWEKLQGVVGLKNKSLVI